LHNKKKILIIKKITPAPKVKAQLKILFKIKAPNIFNGKKKVIKLFILNKSVPNV